jgi:hypothetical protein
MVRPETTQMIDQILEDLSNRFSGDVAYSPPWEYFTPSNPLEANVLGAYRLDLDQAYFNQTYLEEVEDNPAQVARLVVHEWRHFWQDQTGFSDNPQIRETDARQFENSYVERLAFPHDQLAASSAVPSRRCGCFLDHQTIQDVPTEVLSTGVVPRISLGRWIRFHLTKEVSEDYVYRMWKAYEELKASAGQKESTYDHFRRYIWILDELKLIRLTRTEKASGIGVRHYYRALLPGLDDPAWDNPQAAKKLLGS